MAQSEASRPVILPPRSPGTLPGTRTIQRPELGRLSPIGPATPAAVYPDRVWNVQFNNAPVGEVLSTLARCTGREIVLSGTVAGNVTVQLNGRSTDDAVRLVAASAGLHAASVGTTWVVGSAVELRRACEEFGTTESLTLAHVPAKDAAVWIASRLPLLRCDAVGDRLVFSGLPTDIASARALLEGLDRAAPETISEETVSVSQIAEPEKTATDLHRLFPELEVDALGSIWRLRGPASSVTAAAKALAGWDSAAGARPSQVVVDLRYVHAERAAEALRKAVPDIQATAAPEPTAPPSANFAPLGGGFAGPGGGSGGGGGMGQGAGGGGAAGGMAGGTGGRSSGEQPVSRSTRLILSGPARAVTAARNVLDATDVPAPMARIEASVFEVDEAGLEETGMSSVVSGEIGFVIPGGKGTDLNGSDIQRTPISVNSALRALVTRNRAKLLAQPSLSVVDNEDASIFIGDLIRFRGSTFTPGTGGVIQGVETIPVGIALLLRPRIHPDGNITLKVHPVVGSLVEDDGNGLPRTSSREADTTVRLKPREELVIGGLDRSDQRTIWRKIPFLGDLPLLGDLFRGRTERLQKTRIVVVLRATALPTSPLPTADNRFP